MSLRRPAKNQPETFEFSSSSMEEAKKIVLKYPEGNSKALLWLYYISLKNRMIIGYHWLL